MEKTTFVIADDHPIVRKVIRKKCLRNKAHRVIGEVGNGLELLDLLRTVLPDIIILDLEMPHYKGYDLIPEIKKCYPEVKIIVFSGFIDEKSQKKLIDDGADATVSKSEPSSILRLAIERVKDNCRYHSDCSNGFFAPLPPVEKSNVNLTRREKEILMLLAKGKNSKDISEICCISVNTVNKHRSNIKQKIRVKTLSQMIAYPYNAI